MNIQGFPFMVAVILVTTLRAATVSSPQDQGTLAQQLLSDKAAERNAALNKIRSLEPQQVGPPVRAALIALMERQNTLIEEVRRTGGYVADSLNPEFHARVCQTVAQLRDASSIHALARGLGKCGWQIHKDLAAFGEQAAPAVVAVVVSPQSSYDTVNEGLIALRFMVEDTNKRPLSKGSLEAIRAAALKRLTGKQYFTTLWGAVDLAMVIEDPALTAIVSSLAYDSKEIMARGVTDADLIERTQQRARDRLAGLPSLPRR
jgi:hypothetical protein